MDAVAALDLLLRGLGFLMTVDEYVAEVAARRNAGQSDEEISTWIKETAMANISAAKAAVANMPDDQPG